MSKSSSGGALVRANWSIDDQNACKAGSYYHLRDFMSDHIILWYDQDSYGEVQRKIEEKKRDAKSNTYHPLLQIQFTVDSPKILGKAAGDIKEIWRIRLDLALSPRLRKSLKELANRRSKYEATDDDMMMSDDYIRLLRLALLPHLHSIGSSRTEFNWTLRNIWSLRLRKPLKELSEKNTINRNHLNKKQQGDVLDQLWIEVVPFTNPAFSKC
ncbi:hypothetical protein K1719_019609 [Acacia pycnantha]|nr:hypothetical protein K1719_019609 [Acacia pycnantha]